MIIPNERRVQHCTNAVSWHSLLSVFWVAVLFSRIEQDPWNLIPATFLCTLPGAGERTAPRHIGNFHLKSIMGWAVEDFFWKCNVSVRCACVHSKPDALTLKTEYLETLKAKEGFWRILIQNWRCTANHIFSYNSYKYGSFAHLCNCEMGR